MSRLAIALAVSATAAFAQAPAASADPSTYVRLAGPDRYSTAVEISKDWYSAANTVVVASGENYPDALAAGPAAAMWAGPVLLTRSTSVPSVTAVEIARLQPQRIVVVGGPAAVSEAVVNELKTLAPVLRLSGADRRATAAAVAAAMFEMTPSSGIGEVFIASGDVYTDALVAASAAANVQGPLLLAPHQGLIDATTLAQIQRLRPQRIRLVGDGASVAALQQLQAAGYTANRIVAATPYELSVAVAETQRAILGSGIAYLATQSSFPDALAAVGVAGHNSSMVYLTPSTCLPWQVWYDLAATGVHTVRIVGGPAAIIDGVQNVQCP